MKEINILFGALLFTAVISLMDFMGMVVFDELQFPEMTRTLPGQAQKEVAEQSSYPQELYDAAQSKDSGNIKTFMSYFNKNWEDIHDVIMRFHHEDPGLKGTTSIAMTWRNGSLVSASVLNSDTGNPDLGPALISAMKNWNISGMTGEWFTILPLQTAIVGSDQPEFNESGIITGKVTDKSGNPLHRARLVLIPLNNPNAKSDTLFTNREGIFIKTMVPAGKWRLEFSKISFETTILDNLKIEKGKHIKKSINLIH